MAHTEQKRTTETMRTSPSDAPICVLLIEDEPADVRLVTEALRCSSSTQFDLTTVSRLADGLRLLADRRFDVVLLDLNLPDCDGLDTFARLCEAAPGLPIVILTGTDDEAAAVEAMRQGAQDYLVKGEIGDRWVGRALRYAVERHRSKAALDESESRFWRVFHDAAVGICLVDPEGAVLHANAALRDMLGYRESELQGRRFWEFGHKDDVAEHLRLYEKLLDGSLNHFHLEKRCLHKSGEVLWTSLTQSAVRDKQGALHYSIEVAQDVTARKKLEKELANLFVDKQRRTGQDLHDGLGQHLTGMGLLAQGLQWKLQAARSPHASAAQELLVLIDGAKNQLRRIVKGLHPVDVHSIGLRKALEQLTRSTAAHTGIVCTFECEGTGTVEDNTTATQLFYIAQEAVNNAVKHAKTKQITVRLSALEGRLSLVIQDDGVGLPANVEDTEGVGLRIMRHRADVIGGALSFGRETSGGTVVTCTIQEKRPHAQAQIPSEA